VPWRERSLRTRLTVLVAGAMAAAVVVMWLSTWLLLRANLYVEFDAQLQTYAQVAAKLASPAEAVATLRTVERPGLDTGAGNDDMLVVQFLNPDGTRAGAAGAAAAIPVGPVSRQVASGAVAAASEVETIAGSRYRIWTVARPGGGAVQVARNSAELEHRPDVLGFWLAVAGLVGVLGAALAGRAVARSALRPVDALTVAAEEIARTQELSAGITVTGKDELARLAESFNAMLTALKDSRDEQRRLIQDAGHELRTPLTSLRNNIELLIHADGQHRALPAEDRARLLADLGVQSAELTTLMQELVDLSTGEHEPEPVELIDLADVLDATAARVRARSPQIRFDIELASAEVNGRAAALERAVLNVLDNAAKWSPPGGIVTARVIRDAESVPPQGRIVVSDQGPGIADVDLPHVFERFYRAETARSRPGSGLGLAIVEQVVTQHGGTVHAARDVSSGARFELAFPLAASGCPPNSVR
jgi:two-component system, OmpR family, sensor histidine kinase MprB